MGFKTVTEGLTVEFSVTVSESEKAVKMTVCVNGDPDTVMVMTPKAARHIASELLRAVKMAETSEVAPVV